MGHDEGSCGEFGGHGLDGEVDGVEGVLVYPAVGYGGGAGFGG